MNPADKVKNFIRSTKIKTNPDIDRKILNELLAELDTSTSRDVSDQPGIWRTIMMNKMTRFAVAATVVFAVFVGVNVFDRKSGIVWADVVQRLEDIKTVVYNTTAEVEGLPGTPEGYVSHISQYVMVSYETEAVRIDSSIEGPRGTTNTRTHIVFADGQLVTLLLDKKKYFEVEISDEHMEKMEAEKGDPVTLLSVMLEHDYIELGQKEIEGVRAWGIEVSDPKLGPQMGGFISAGMFDHTTVRLWVDDENELPILIEATGSSLDGKASMDMSIDDFHWNVEIAPSELEAVIPDDFELLAQTTWESGNEGEEIIEVLRLFVDFADGKYPATLNTITVSNALVPALKENFPQKPGKEIIARLMKVDMVGRLYAIMEKDGKVPAYYGDRVTADDKDALLFRWRQEDGRYKAVFGDLTTKVVTEQELLRLEAIAVN